jgi:hypothetical protein
MVLLIDLNLRINKASFLTRPSQIIPNNPDMRRYIYVSDRRRENEVIIFLQSQLMESYISFLFVIQIKRGISLLISKLSASIRVEENENTSILDIIHSLTHGAEPFLRSCQLCSRSRSSQSFMEPEGSLPRSQEPSIVPHPEPD